MMEMRLLYLYSQVMEQVQRWRANVRFQAFRYQKQPEVCPLVLLQGCKVPMVLCQFQLEPMARSRASWFPRLADEVIA